MLNSSEFNSEDFEKIEVEFAKIIQRSCSILLFGPSRIKCQTDLNILKEAGFLNVAIETKISALPMIIRKGKTRVIVMDGDLKNNESLKTFMNLKAKKTEKFPSFLFIRDEVSAETLGVYKKAGALDCIQKPLSAVSFEESIRPILFDEENELETFSIETKTFGDSTLIKLRGDMQAKGLNELFEKLADVELEDNDGCLIDFSKVKSLDGSIVNILKNASESYKGSEKSVDIFDPKRKLSKYNLEEVLAFI